MIFGNPDNFAVYIDKVDSWSINNFKEGFIWFYINSIPYPTNGYDYVSTLDVNISSLLTSKLVNPLESKELFNMETLELSKLLLKKRYPSWVFESESKYLSYPDELYEQEELLYYVDIDFLIKARLVMFVVKYNQKVRLIVVNTDFANDDFLDLKTLKKEYIVDKKLSIKDLNTIVANIKTYISNMS